MGYTGVMEKCKQSEKASPKAHALGTRLRAWASLPAPLVPCFFGFAFSRAANDLLVHQLALTDAFGPLWGEDFYSLAMLAAFLICAALARRIAPLYRKLWVVRGTAGLAIAASLLVLASGTGGAVQEVLLAAAMAAGGVAGALFILLWAEFHSCLDPLRIVLYVSGAFLFGSTGAWLLQDLDPVRTALVLIALPLASVWCLHRSFAQIAPMDLPRSVWGRYEFPWKLIAVLGVYELAYGVWEASPSFVWETYTIGAIGVALAVFALVCFCSRRFDFALLYRTPFAFMLCGLAMAPLTAAFGEFASDLGVSAGYSLMFLVLTFLLCDLSHRYGVSVLVLCGMQELTAAFRLAGHQIPAATASGALPPFANDAFVSTLLTVAVVVASIALLFGNDLPGKWGASFFGVGTMAAENDDHGRLVERCAALSDVHGLSPREREVFELLAQGKRPSAIERELVIANGTLKSHTRRIYQKLGIHSKKELQNMVGGDMLDEAEA